MIKSCDDELNTKLSRIYSLYKRFDRTDFDQVHELMDLTLRAWSLTTQKTSELDVLYDDIMDAYSKLEQVIAVDQMIAAEYKKFYADHKNSHIVGEKQ